VLASSQNSGGPATPRSTGATTPKKGAKGPSTPAHGQAYLIVNKQNQDEIAFHLKWSKDYWKPDFDLRDDVKAVLALKQLAFPDDWLAIVVRDFGTRNPRELELKLETQYYVGGRFKGDPERSEMLKTQFLDQPALSCKFSGTDKDGTKCKAICYALAYRGLGYWFIAGSSDLSRAEGLLADLQGGKVMTWSWPESRKDWTEKPPEMEAFKGATQPFTLRAIKEVWLPMDLENVKAFHEDADLGLEAEHPEKRYDEKKLATKDARVLVFVNKTNATSARAALDEYIKELTTEQVGDNADKKLAVAGEVKADDTFKMAGKPAARADVVLSIDGEPHRYFLVAVVVHGGRMYVVRGECIWSMREFWKSDLLELLNGFELNH
jgi:hypothetical protein